MDMIADALLFAGAITAALYCWVLAKRVKGLNDLDTGLGSAIASLSSQVNDMQSALRATQAVTGSSVEDMTELAERAERAAEKLKLMLATVQEDKEEQDPPSRKTSRVRKFPKRSKNEDLSESEPELKATRGYVQDEPEPAARRTPARKMQKNVAEKILERDDADSREELVQALQSILAASK